MKPYRHEQDFGPVRVVYGRQPSTAERLEPSISATHCIDLAFIGHTNTLVRGPSGPTYARTIPAGTGGMHGGELLEFVRVEGPSEYMELSPSPAVRKAAADYYRAPGAIDFAEIPGIDDRVLWSAAVRFRAHAMGGWPLDTLEAETLIRSLVGHLACTHLGGRRPRVNDSRLSSPVLTELRDYIEASIATPIAVTDLARLAHRSPYHFMRTFALTTGMKPHQYVRAIRMERAKAALLQGASVRATARSVGYVPGHSFRRAFHQYFGMHPSAFVAAVR